MEKGQVTIEFIIILALVSLIFLVTINFIFAERKTTSQMLWSVDAQDNAEKIAFAVNSVYLSGDGTRMNLTLPKKLVGGVNYTVTVRRRLVTVNVSTYNREFEWKFQTANVQGAQDGLSLDPGVITIVNRNGTINLTSY